MIRGIDDGWAELTFPRDPLDEDPQYVLTIVDSEKFAEGVEKLFPEVDWDEPVSAAVAESAAQADGGPTKKPKKSKKKWGPCGAPRGSSLSSAKAPGARDRWCPGREQDG